MFLQAEGGRTSSTNEAKKIMHQFLCTNNTAVTYQHLCMRCFPHPPSNQRDEAAPCFLFLVTTTLNLIRLYHPTVTIKDTTIIYGCACLGHSLTSPFVGLPQDKRRLGLRRTAAVGATLVALATLASSMATSVVGLAVLNAFFGVGIGLA